MKVIIAGSRTVNSYQDVYDAVLDSKFDVTEIVSGGARGVDKLGERYGKNSGIKTKVFLADWYKNGRSGGYIRNSLMGKYADALIAVWDGNSAGTGHMIDLMRKLNKPVYVKQV